MRDIEYQGDAYKVSLTRPKRRCDVARFQVQKQGGKTYTITFQNMEGSKGQCDCQAGKRRKFCRHLQMLKPLLERAVAAATGAKAPQKPQKPVQIGAPKQMGLPFEDDATKLYEAARAEYAVLQRQKKEIEAKMAEVEARGKALKAQLEKATAA